MELVRVPDIGLISIRDDAGRDDDRLIISTMDSVSISRARSSSISQIYFSIMDFMAF